MWPQAKERGHHQELQEVRKGPSPPASGGGTAPADSSVWAGHTDCRPLASRTVREYIPVV